MFIFDCKNWEQGQIKKNNAMKEFNIVLFRFDAGYIVLFSFDAGYLIFCIF